jgi:hypothetical protein
MANQPDKKVSVLAFVLALLLMATGIVSLPIGLFLLALDKTLYGVGLLAYGACAVLIAMYGSDRTVIAAVIGIVFGVAKPEKPKKEH